MAGPIRDEVKRHIGAVLRWGQRLCRPARGSAKTRVILNRAAWVTAVWLVIATIALSVANHADLKANELADIFAGVFAPVAFGWFVTATLLQRDELELQRRELKITQQTQIDQQA